MKNLKLYLVMAFMTFSILSYAQSLDVENKTENNSNDDENFYARLELSYNPIKMSVDIDDADDLELNAFYIGQIFGLSISKSLPAFIEFGWNMSYAFKSIENEWMNDIFKSSDKDVILKMKYSLMTVSVPINMSYKLKVSNSDVSIVPYIGLNLKYNASAHVKYEFEGSDAKKYVQDCQRNDFEEYKKLYGEQNMFNEDDERVGEDGKWKRFQVGWNIGVGLNYKKLYLGLKYGKDFTELCKKLILQIGQ